ncbi:hypothetical protein C7S18_12330 [Ahniella affigens]|uniref:HTH Mu-type domain-containing protein n=1 Tax=Ahniella affigens TaxID=2021234 RepID=A0A2P1PSW7_9GAMM|nr:transposase domain-containing protein [Ahniella affigens]AVP97939.1 hypothetical protein C7S18_12330 [Ahniella affigens]
MTTEQRFLSAAELAGLPGMPSTTRGVLKTSVREGWESRRRKRGKGLEYAIASLPAVTRAALLIATPPEAAPKPATSTRKLAAIAHDQLIRAAWERYESATATMRAEAVQAAQQLDAVAALVAGGTPKCAARDQVAAAMRAANLKGASAPSLARWERAVGNAARADWPALLLPDYTGRTSTAEIPDVLWDFFKSSYMSRDRKSASSCYRRTAELAAKQGKAMPSLKTFVRRLESEVDSLSLTLSREGPEALRRRLPSIDRDSTVFSAGQAVNGDGLKFDRLYVCFEDGEILNTATAWVWQDIRTRRILAWRLAKTEHTDCFRLATYDLTAVCAPEYCWIDNTRVAANKLMTAGAAGRHRFKSDPADGVGLLQMLGIEPHFTSPNAETGNPGAKPIERAFGIGGLHSEVATNPRITAVGGFSPSTAIPVQLLREVIAEEVARHNARAKRRTPVCRGVLSFDQAWAESVAKHPVRVLSDAQRRLLLMTREIVTIPKTGVIVLDAGQSRHGRNKFWSDAAPNLIDQRVSVHFDPANISAGVHVYSLDGRYLFAAEHMPSRAYNDTDAAAEAKRLRTRITKHAKRGLEQERRLNQLEQEKLYATAEKPAPAPQPQPETNVVRPVFTRPHDPDRDAARAIQRTGTDSREADLNSFLEAFQRKRNQALGFTPQE